MYADSQSFTGALVKELRKRKEAKTRGRHLSVWNREVHERDSHGGTRGLLVIKFEFAAFIERQQRNENIDALVPELANIVLQPLSALRSGSNRKLQR
jgi:hypothetical protein